MNFQSAYNQLSPAERAFVDAYVKALMDAAARANESPVNALARPIPADHIEYSRGLLERPLVVAAIAEVVRDFAAQNDLSPQRLIAEYMSIGFSNVKNYFAMDYDGSPKLDLTNCTDEQWRAIAELNIDYHANGLCKSVKFKLHPKMEALSKLGQYMGVLERDNPYWKNNTDDVGPLPEDIGADEASNRYARMIAGT